MWSTPYGNYELETELIRLYGLSSKTLHVRSIEAVVGALGPGTRAILGSISSTQLEELLPAVPDSVAVLSSCSTSPRFKDVANVIRTMSSDGDTNGNLQRLVASSHYTTLRVLVESDSVWSVDMAAMLQEAFADSDTTITAHTDLALPNVVTMRADADAAYILLWEPDDLAQQDVGGLHGTRLILGDAFAFRRDRLTMSLMASNTGRALFSGPLGTDMHLAGNLMPDLHATPFAANIGQLLRMLVLADKEGPMPAALLAMYGPAGSGMLDAFGEAAAHTTNVMNVTIPDVRADDPPAAPPTDAVWPPPPVEEVQAASLRSQASLQAAHSTQVVLETVKGGAPRPGQWLVETVLSDAPLDP